MFHLPSQTVPSLQPKPTSRSSLWDYRTIHAKEDFHKAASSSDLKDWLVMSLCFSLWISYYPWIYNRTVLPPKHTLRNTERMVPYQQSVRSILGRSKIWKVLKGSDLLYGNLSTGGCKYSTNLITVRCEACLLFSLISPLFSLLLHHLTIKTINLSVN
jgi:hypothetical protein